MAGVGVANSGKQGSQQSRGSLYQQRSYGSWAPIPGGPQWQEFGDSVEERGVLLSSTACKCEVTPERKFDKFLFFLYCKQLSVPHVSIWEVRHHIENMIEHYLTCLS